MLNERIKQLRKQSGYSQMQLAKKLHLTQGAISQWENGLTVPAADQLVFQFEPLFRVQDGVQNVFNQ